MSRKRRSLIGPSVGADHGLSPPACCLQDGRQAACSSSLPEIGMEQFPQTFVGRDELLGVFHRLPVPVDGGHFPCDFALDGEEERLGESEAPLVASHVEEAVGPAKEIAASHGGASAPCGRLSVAGARAGLWRCGHWRMTLGASLDVINKGPASHRVGGRSALIGDARAALFLSIRNLMRHAIAQRRAAPPPSHVDILPVLKAGASYGAQARHRAVSESLRRVPASDRQRGSIHGPSGRAPPLSSSNPRARMLIAPTRSALSSNPHSTHSNRACV
jgi:hypothetical protein